MCFRADPKGLAPDEYASDLSLPLSLLMSNVGESETPLLGRPREEAASESARLRYKC
jgi:hypothetical protein